MSKMGIEARMALHFPSIRARGDEERRMQAYGCGLFAPQRQTRRSGVQNRLELGGSEGENWR